MVRKCFKNIVPNITMLKRDIIKEIEKYERLAIDARNRASYRVNLIQTHLEKLKKEEQDG